MARQETSGSGRPGKAGAGYVVVRTVGELLITAGLVIGADMKRLRNTAGLKALTRVAKSRSPATRNGGEKPQVAVTMADLRSSLDTLRSHSSLVEV